MQPYKNESLNTLYDLLFCDNADAFRSQTNAAENTSLLAVLNPSSDADTLLGIANDRSMESRVRALAAHRLHALGQAANPELLGVIVEVGMVGGLDVLAAYGDGSARFFSHAERLIIFDAPTADSNQLIAQLWQAGVQVVNQIGPWDKARLDPPTAGMVRLSFLVSGQLYFGQGPIDVFFGDPMAGPVLGAATQLMNYLTQLG